MARIGRVKENYKPRDEYYTPDWIFSKMGLIFDLDPAHPPFATSVPCAYYYTKEQDGLNQKWFGSVWMNPPFSESKRWVHKFMEHRNGVALLPFAKSQWMTDIWNDAEAITVLPYNIRFSYEGKLNGSIFLPVGLFAYGQEHVKALDKIGVVR